MKITAFTAHKVESKHEQPAYAYYSPYTRINPEIWINSSWEIMNSRSFVKELEKEFQSINGIMHEQLELFNE